MQLLHGRKDFLMKKNNQQMIINQQTKMINFDSEERKKKKYPVCFNSSFFNYKKSIYNFHKFIDVFIIIIFFFVL